MGTTGCRNEGLQGEGGGRRWREDPETIALMPGLMDPQIRICNLLAEELRVRRKQLIEPWGKPTLGGQELKIVGE